MIGLALVLLWLAVAYRLYLVRNDRSPWRTSFAASILFVALGGTLHCWVDRTLGVEAVPFVRCLGIGALVLAAGSVDVFVMSLREGMVQPRFVWRRLLSAAVVTVVSVECWEYAARHRESLTLTTPPLAIVMLYLVSHVYLVGALSRVVGFCFHEVAQYGRTRLSHTLPLRLIGTACALAVGYIGATLAHVTLNHFGDGQLAETIGRFTQWIPYPALALLAAGILALLLGTTLSTYVALTSTLIRLRPLWASLTKERPALRLDVPVRRDLGRWLSLRTYRMVTEIQDSLAERLVDAPRGAGCEALAHALRSGRIGTTPAAEVLPLPETVQEERHQLLELAHHYKKAQR